MKDVMKQNRGVSLTSLVIAVTIIIIITGMLVYNTKDSVYIQRLTNMYNDIENLREKISEYYLEYDNIPAKLQYTDNEALEDSLGANDGDVFYVIDLEALDGLTLNYGKDYEEVKLLTQEDQDTINGYKDLYIINDNSHNIFYVQGIKYELNGEMKVYYTDEKEPDNKKVELKYVDGIKIPDDAEYIEGRKKTGIKILGEDGVTYTWVVLDKKIETELPDKISITDEEKEEFIRSANAYEGYYANEEDPDNVKVKYLSLDNEENNWIYKYDDEGIYTDVNEQKIYVPSNCSISGTPTINKVASGLVIKDNNDDEYIWISVPNSILKDATTEEEIEQALKEYTKNYKEEGYEDSWYEGCGLTQNEYNELKTKMLFSIKENGGFYVSRYEMGINNEKKSGLSSEGIESLVTTNGYPQSKKNLYPYNYVTCNQAQQLADQIKEHTFNGRYNVSLLFGIQWDLICRYLEESDVKTLEELTDSSVDYGNYKDSQVTGISKYFDINGTSWTEETSNTIKLQDSIWMLKTGNSNYTRVNNIYDLAGNMGEFTLEQNKNATDGKIVTIRGGNCSQTEKTIKTRDICSIDDFNYNIGFRVTVFK